MDWSSDSTLDRVEEHRDDAAWLHEQWHSPTARVLPVGPGGRLPVASDATLRYAPAAGELDPMTTHLLGLADGEPIFCQVVDTVAGDTATVREIGHRLTATQSDVAFSATALANWHRIEPRCSACGALTEPRRAGLMRHCPECGRDSWPRTDPAVIVAVTNGDDEILLAHQTAWPPAVCRCSQASSRQVNRWNRPSIARSSRNQAYGWESCATSAANPGPIPVR
ncbi:NADH pyrophosphatase zinc ribbon domain-containing protein [Raineyella fluvialis]|nr:NADH pyrophosphatase zinc ribbon domain-containing protein [Raineyella fluvialis]